MIISPLGVNLDPTLRVIKDVEAAFAVEVERARKHEFPWTLPLSADGPEVAAFGIEHLDALIPAVGDVDVPGGVHGQVELEGRFSSSESTSPISPHQLERDFRRVPQAPLLTLCTIRTISVGGSGFTRV